MAAIIERKLTQAGYRMLGGDESIERLILDILKTQNIRYLKAIPFLLYKYQLDVHNIYKKTRNKELFNAITGISSRIFQESNIHKILPYYSGLDKNLEKEYAKKFLLHYDEFREEFELQLRNESRPALLIDKQKIYAERDLQMQLSQLFTKKERYIIKRMLEDKPVSRTEYEYYSRKTRKKLNSIISLQDFARSIYSKTPAYDEGLFDFKKKLERLMEKESGGKDISLISFYLDDGRLYMNGTGPEGCLLSKTIRLNDIKDKKTLKLLHEYQGHDFR